MLNVYFKTTKLDGTHFRIDLINTNHKLKSKKKTMTEDFKAVLTSVEKREPWPLWPPIIYPLGKRKDMLTIHPLK